MGSAIVCSRGLATEGYVTSGEDALLIPPSDPVALRDAVQRLVSDPTLRRGLAATAEARRASYGFCVSLSALRREIIRLAEGR